jgi:hypothetical protein
MRMLQKIHDAFTGPPQDAPPLPPRDLGRVPPTPVRTRMATPPDVAMILDARADRTGFGGGWRTSLPALFALIGLADTPESRRRMADDLNVDIDDADPDEADARLHAALIQRLAENDATAPQDFFK